MSVLSSLVDQQSRQLGVTDVAGVFGLLKTLDSYGSSLQGLPATIGRGYPDAKSLTLEVDLQSPSGVEAGNGFVAYGFGADWVYDSKFSVTQNDFWSNPNQIDADSNDNIEQEIENLILCFAREEKALKHETAQKEVGDACPDEISSRSKNLIHNSIMATAPHSSEDKKND